MSDAPDFTITDWFDDELWQHYPRDLCNRIGSKSKALISVKAKVKNRDLANKIMASLREQILYYRKVKKSGAHGAEWKMPMLSTWLSGERWTDEIGSHSDLASKRAAKNCECGAEVDISNLCWTCYDRTTGIKDWREDILWKYFTDNNLHIQPNESKEAWIERLRARSRLGYRKIG